MTPAPAKAAMIASMRLFALACLRLAGVDTRQAIRIMNQLNDTAKQTADELIKQLQKGA